MSAGTHAPAVFLDKDGTLIRNIPYNVDPAQIRLMPHALSACAALHRAGFRLVIVSNQSGVARGLFAESALLRVRERLERLLASVGVPLAGFYFCPHAPDGSIAQYAVACDCRKPNCGMLRQAARELDIDLTSSWMVGDILDDVEAGRRAGCRAILIDNDNETEWIVTPIRQPDHVVSNLRAAAQCITAQ